MTRLFERRNAAGERVEVAALDGILRGAFRRRGSGIGAFARALCRNRDVVEPAIDRGKQFAQRLCLRFDRRYASGKRRVGRP